MIRHSRQHLAAAGKGNGEHLGFAATAGRLAIAPDLAGLSHPLMPALRTRTCSVIITRLQRLFGERGLVEQVTQQAAGALALVRLVQLAFLATAGPVLCGAGAQLGTPFGLLAFTVPLTVGANVEVDNIRALAWEEWLTRTLGEWRNAKPRLMLGNNSPFPA